MSSAAPIESTQDFFMRMGTAITENDFETIKEGFTPFKPYRPYEKYGQKLLKLGFKADGKENSTLIHYALRKGASDKILEFLAEFPHDKTAKSAGQTYYDIALENNNFVGQVLFIPDNEKLRLIQNVHNIITNDSNINELEELLKNHMVIFGLSFSSRYYTTIFSFAIDNNAPKEVFKLLVKYAQIYDLEHKQFNGDPIFDKKQLYLDAYAAELPKDILKLLEPDADINSKILAGLKINRNVSANALAPAPHPAGSAATNTSPKSSLRYQIRDVEGLKVMTILKGTLLFNAYEVMSLETRKEKEFGDIFHPDNTYLQLLNGILPLSTSITHDDKTIKIKGCIDKNSSKFFYGNPVGGPALGSVNTNFNTLAAFELKHDINLVLLMSPAHQHRLDGIDNIEIFTCDKLSEKYGKQVGQKDKTAYCRCTYNTTLKACPFSFPYDVCIKPEFLKKHNIHGHVAMAEADSYEKTMKYFDSDFVNNPHISTKYKILNSLLFEACISIDNRPHKNSEYISDDIIGFPEIVLQLYGSQWYETDLHEQHFEDEIPIENNDPRATIVKYLLNVNTSRLFKNADNPLKLKYVSTSRALYNLTNGTIIENPFIHLAIYNEIQKKYAMHYYLNYLEAYLRKEINFFVDPRNGFLMNANFANEILMNHNTSTEKSLLETSLIQRKNEALYKLNKFLYPMYFSAIYIRTNSINANNTNNSSNSSKMAGGGFRSRFTKKIKSFNNKKIHKITMKKQAIRTQPYITKKQYHKNKTMRNAIKGIAPRYKIIEKKQHHHESKFTTPLWIDQEYMKICQIIKAYL